MLANIGAYIGASMQIWRVPYTSAQYGLSYEFIASPAVLQICKMPSTI